MKRMNSPRAITALTFDKLLARLGPDRELAGEEYESLRRRLVKYFDLKGINLPEAAADEALDRMAIRIEAGEEIRDLVHYAYGVAHWIFLEKLRAEQRERKAYDDLAQRHIPDNNQRMPYLEALEICLKKLCADDRDLICSYYTDEVSFEAARQRTELAKKKGLSPNSLRLRMFRLRQVLERCIDAES